jgi:hypothetical protein
MGNESMFSIKFRLILSLFVLNSCSQTTSSRDLIHDRESPSTESLTPEQKDLGLSSEIAIPEQGLEVTDGDEIPSSGFPSVDLCVEKFANQVPKNLEVLKGFCTEFISSLKAKPLDVGTHPFVGAFFVPSAPGQPHVGHLKRFWNGNGTTDWRIYQNDKLGTGVPGGNGLYVKWVLVIHKPYEGLVKTYSKSAVLDRGVFRSDLTINVTLMKIAPEIKIKIHKVVSFFDVGTKVGEICRVLKSGDAYFPSWKSCCDHSSQAYSYWVPAGQPMASGSWYSGSCQAWGVLPGK